MYPYHAQPHRRRHLPSQVIHAAAHDARVVGHDTVVAGKLALALWKAADHWLAPVREGMEFVKHTEQGQEIARELLDRNFARAAALCVAQTGNRKHRVAVLAGAAIQTVGAVVEAGTQRRQANPTPARVTKNVAQSEIVFGISDDRRTSP